MKSTENELYNEISRINNDLTRLRREVDKKNRLLKEANNELAIANQDMSEFSHAVSHDLKNPLQGIYKYCNLLMGGHAEIRPELDKIRFNVAGLLEMIDALLALGKIQSTQLKREPFNISELFLTVGQEIQARNMDHIIELEGTALAGTGIDQTGIEEAPVATCTVHADKALVKVLLTNILENCWKYTRGCEQVKVQLGVDSRSGETLFYIRDNGPGIRGDAVNDIFTPFKRAHQHGATDIQGHGIGLSTVFRIIRKHQGKIFAQSEEGQGLTIFFNLEPASP